MRNLVTVLLLLFAMQSFSQTQYEVIGEGDQKVLKGIITRDLIAKDTAFKWYQQFEAGYTPAAPVVSAIKAKAGKLQWVVFGGTWCGDTRFILPRFFTLADAAGIVNSQLTLIGVDHNKKTIGNLTEALNITNVPTIIVLKDGLEVGRVVEYGKTGQWDKELSEIVSTIKN